MMRELLMQNPDALQAVQALSDKIASVQDELSTLEKVGANQQPQQQTELENGDSKLEKEVTYMAAEVDVLKKSAPEEHPEDNNVQYFLAVAEMQQTNEMLREQEHFCQKNLSSLNDDIQATQGLIANWMEINEALNKMKKEKDEAGQTNKDDDQKTKSKQTLDDLDNKIRGTRKAYKELKTFLGEFLQRIEPVNTDEENPVGGHLGMLLQELWSAFQEREGDDRDGHVNISHLSFDVDKKHVNLLVQSGIVEMSPDNPDRICLVDFTM